MNYRDTIIKQNLAEAERLRPQLGRDGAQTVDEIKGALNAGRELTREEFNALHHLAQRGELRYK